MAYSKGRDVPAPKLGTVKAPGAGPWFHEGEEVMLRKFKLASALALALSAPAFAADTPGVTATEIKIGGVFPFSGPASSIGLVGRGVLAYVPSINDRGGINGRKIDYV